MVLTVITCSLELLYYSKLFLQLNNANTIHKKNVVKHLLHRCINT